MNVGMPRSQPARAAKPELHIVLAAMKAAAKDVELLPGTGIRSGIFSYVRETLMGEENALDPLTFCAHAFERALEHMAMVYYIGVIEGKLDIAQLRLSRQGIMDAAAAWSANVDRAKAFGDLEPTVNLCPLIEAVMHETLDEILRG